MAAIQLMFLFIVFAGCVTRAQIGGQGFNKGPDGGAPARPGADGGGRPPFEGQPARPGANGGGRPPVFDGKAI